jgi:hypothetical protein
VNTSCETNAIASEAKAWSAPVLVKLDYKLRDVKSSLFNPDDAVVGAGQDDFS